jgi:hypothetical protein
MKRPGTLSNAHETLSNAHETLRNAHETLRNAHETLRNAHETGRNGERSGTPMNVRVENGHGTVTFNASKTKETLYLL